MLVRGDERAPIARLLAFLEAGERMAEWCTRAQAGLAPDSGSARFLATQARQEAMHAVVFCSAIVWLTPRRSAASPLLVPMEGYRALLHDAIRRRDFLETLLAEQIILEGLGEAILGRIEAGLAKRGAPFGRLRRVLLHQEEAHHEFGTRTLERAIQRGEVSVAELHGKGAPYLALVEPMVMTLSDLFDAVREDAAAWVADARAFLPSWLHTPESSSSNSSVQWAVPPTPNP